jgi:hypothetical protein
MPAAGDASCRSHGRRGAGNSIGRHRLPDPGRGQGRRHPRRTDPRPGTTLPRPRSRRRSRGAATAPCRHQVRVVVDVFAATADAAGVPGNRDHLAAIGADFGAIAHLLDAVDDYDTDLTEGVFNPLRATDTDVASALADCRRLAKAIRRRYDLLHLDDDRLLRAVLLDGLHRAISRRSRSHGLVSLCHNHSPESAYPNPTGWPPFPPPDYPESWPYPPPFRPNRGFLERLGPFVWTTCSGQACCTDHWNHCSDKWKNECCDCDDCDCDCCDCDCCDCP